MFAKAFAPFCGDTKVSNIRRLKLSSEMMLHGEHRRSNNAHCQKR